jgi:hypothetical protein
MDTLEVAVDMRRVANTGAAVRWESHRWELVGVTPLQATIHAAFEAPDIYRFAPFTVALHKDDAQGYQLNLESPAPCWFVMWRKESEDDLPSPQAVSLSYHDAGRWLDSQERCDQVAAQAEVVETLRDFVALHYVAEEKRRKRPDSFKPLIDRFGNRATISTDKP